MSQIARLSAVHNRHLRINQFRTRKENENFYKITVAFDESPESGRALQVAVELAKSLHASLAIIIVIEPAPIHFSFSTLVAPYNRWTDEMRTRYNSLQAKARKLAEDAGLAIEAELSNGDEVDSILEAARHNHSDLLVIGMPKHTWITGRTANRVADGVPCALLGIQ